MAQTHGQKYIVGYKKSHVRNHEWRNAENSAAFLIPVLQDLEKRSGTESSSTEPYPEMLDIGAGSGTITASMAKYIPHGHVTAVDISDEILKRAAEHAESKGVHNISFQTANIFELPFPDDSFDVVHASMVLTHLSKPVDAYKEMLRVTKPGGVVANREADMRLVSVYPDNAPIQLWNKVIADVMVASGGSRDGASRMISWAMQAGAKRDQITFSWGTWTYSTPEEREMWGGMAADRTRTGPMRQKAIEMGVATEDDIEAMAQAWEQWVKTEDACCGNMLGEILIRKQ